MLITLFFYGSEHIDKQVKIHIATYNSISYKNFHSIGDMLIGSKMPLQADIIKFVIVGGDLYPSHNTDTFPLPEKHFVCA